MMTRVQADIVPAVKQWLREQNIGAAIHSSVPRDWTPEEGALLTVADDGGPVLWPVKSHHTVRLTAYAAGRTEARRIVSLAAGKLAESSPRPAGIANIASDMSGVLDARDKATGAMLASVLVTAKARTVEV
ncbi:tail terminator [Mycobacterium phage IdentityCrisis]|uniref:Tail terminator n=1 Tax=Mycobacterium phage IdentityCrisis TaxID=2599866 RepID=A0A5J6TH06_9CAUD|nr:tail terminator [Mycobacterium phage IdentityCrisis]QFG10030.1 tail terminator [Mycobacterium phage IdentityCrisis]